MSARAGDRGKTEAAQVSRRAFITGLAAAAATSGVHAGGARAQLPTRGGTAPAGELRVGFTPDPKAIDPRVVWSVSGWGLVWAVCEPLVTKDAQMKLVPLLAESWDWPSKTTLRLRLRRDVKFHNGEEFTAEAVKYTFDSLLDPSLKWIQAGFRDYFAALDRVTIPDSHTALFHTKYPSRSFLPTLQAMGIVPAKAGATLGEKFGFNAVGTGPYRYVEYVPDRHLILAANDRYWGAPPRSKQLTFRILNENATRVAALESGEVDLINNLPPDAIPRTKANPNLQLLSTPTGRMGYVELLVDRPPLNDVRLRKAIAHAIDKEAINTKILGGLGRVATAPVSPWTMGFHDKLEPYPYDPAKAKALMAQAGYGKGVEVRYLYTGQRQLMSKQIGEAIAGYLEEVGFTIKADMLDWAGYVSKAWARKGEYHIIHGTYGGFTMDPDLAFLYFSRRPRNGYRNARVDELVKRAEETFDAAKVVEIYKEAQGIVWDELPWVPLYFQPELMGASRKLRGFAPRPDEFLVFREASVES